MPTGIEISNLRKTYTSGPPWRRSSTEAVRGLSLSVPTGEITGLLGANGAGKTTTVKMLAGLIIPDSGSISFPASGTQTRLGAVLEGSRNLYWRLSADENIEYFGTLKGVAQARLREQANELLDLFKLSEHRGKAAQALSRGMQQKLAIVVALLGEPQVLLLDEPTLGLDVESSLAIQHLLKAQCAARGLTILLTTHQMEVARNLCRRVAIMRSGSIAMYKDVNELIDLFKRQDFFVRLSAGDWEKSRGLLPTVSHEVTEADREGQLQVQFSLDDPQQVYALMRGFEEAGASLEDFRQSEATLEEVFLSVSRGDLSTEAASPADGKEA